MTRRDIPKTHKLVFSKFVDIGRISKSDFQGMQRYDQSVVIPYMPTRMNSSPWRGAFPRVIMPLSRYSTLGHYPSECLRYSKVTSRNLSIRYIVTPATHLVWRGFDASNVHGCCDSSSATMRAPAENDAAICVHGTTSELACIHIDLAVTH